MTNPTDFLKALVAKTLDGSLKWERDHTSMFFSLKWKAKVGETNLTFYASQSDPSKPHFHLNTSSFKPEYTHLTYGEDKYPEVGTLGEFFIGVERDRKAAVALKVEDDLLEGLNAL